MDDETTARWATARWTTGTGSAGERALVALVAWLRALARLVVPVVCPGCHAPDVTLCVGCRRALHGGVRRCEGDAPRLDRLDGDVLPVWCATAYLGPARGVVVAWKDRGRSDLTRELVVLLGAVGARAAPELGIAGSPARRGASRDVLVVPVPTTARARRTRGRDPVDELARGLVRELTTHRRAMRGVAARAPVLRRGRVAQDQVGLGRRDRSRNATGFGVGSRRDLRGVRCVLVDDVLTTGATLAACETVLRRRGAVVVGAIVLAATPPPGVHEE